MKKIKNILFVMLLVLVTTGFMSPNYAMASNMEELHMSSGDGGSYGEPIEQCGDASDGTDGDPDSLSDGFGFIGDTFGETIADVIEDIELTMEDYMMYILMNHIIFSQH